MRTRCLALAGDPLALALLPASDCGAVWRGVARFDRASDMVYIAWVTVQEPFLERLLLVSLVCGLCLFNTVLHSSAVCIPVCYWTPNSSTGFQVRSDSLNSHWAQILLVKQIRGRWDQVPPSPRSQNPPKSD